MGADALTLFSKLRKIARNIPGLFHGYNIYVDADKLRLIDRVYRSIIPSAKSFADLGSVWNVNAAYSLYSLRKYELEQGILVDTDIPKNLQERLSRIPRLRVVQGDFTGDDIFKTISPVDVVYFLMYYCIRQTLIGMKFFRSIQGQRPALSSTTSSTF